MGIPLQFPPKAAPVLEQSARYKVLWGGRGSGKTESVARTLVVRSTERKLRILCARETQISIKESVHSVIKRVIYDLGIEQYFHITDRAISNVTGSEFIFSGLSDEVIDGIKSMDSPDIVWCEEASSLTWGVWDKLDPSIRASKSEIWFTLNREQDLDPISQTFILNDPPPNSIVIEMEYWDNPFFPDVLRDQMERMKATDYEKYLHIWEGRPVTHSQSSVFKGKFISKTFQPDEDLWSPLLGCDLGFANDPTVLIKAWVFEDRLYVEHEIWQVGLEIELMPDVFSLVPGAKDYIMYTDCARPETISHMRRNGYPRCVPVPKWSGSILDGVERLRAFNKIIVHPRCEHMLFDLSNYSYKIDKVTGNILPHIVDRYSDCIDALRYAITPVIKGHKLKSGVPDRVEDGGLDLLGNPIRRMPDQIARQNMAAMIAGGNSWMY